MAKPLIFANWKNHPKSFKDAKKLLEVTRKAAEKAPGFSVIVAPPMMYLRELSATKSTKIKFAAQAMHWDEEGAHTGESTLSQIEESKVSYVLIGHAERRARGETNDDTRRNVELALNRGMIPALCVGEKERDSDGAYFMQIRDQIREGLRSAPMAKVGKVIIAYEPVWNIGAEETMNPRQMHEMAIFIRKTIYDAHGKLGLNTTVLYGGSVNEKNAAQMLALGDVQGLLVGHSSIDEGKITALLGSFSRLK